MNKTKIQLSKIGHRGEIRIKVAMGKRADLIEKIRSIQGRKWSKTKNCWHLPYQISTFETVKKVFGEENVFFEKKKKSSVLPNKDSIHSNQKGKIQPNIQEYPFYGEIRKKYVGEKILVQDFNKAWIKIYVPQDKKGWSEVVRNIIGRKWKTEHTCWIVPNVKSSFIDLRKYIGLENVQLDLDVDKNIPNEFDPIYSNSSKNKKIRLGRN